MTPEQVATLHRLKNDFEYYAPRCLKILDKEGKIKPFSMNEAQRYVHAKIEAQLKATGKVRALVLKGRQQGVSTYVEGRYYWKLQFSKGKKAFILTHEQAATDNLFVMTKRYHDSMIDGLRPSTGASNAKELIFDRLDSGIKVATAGSKDVGRSSTIQYWHGSEVAHWPHAESHMAGVGQAVPDLPDTEIIFESTADGIGNLFQNMWVAAEKGQGEFIAIFVPWFWQPEYTRTAPASFVRTVEEQELAEAYGLNDGQLFWRRSKIETDFANDVSQFHGQYPNNASEAFVVPNKDTLIPARDIMAARKQQNVSMAGPLVIGVDPARFGDDRTAIVHRKGRVVPKVKTYAKKNTMQVAGIVAQLIEADKPSRVFIDIIGLGAGVYDRLVELGYGEIVCAVQASESAINDDKYRNKRAECWVGMRDWFAEKPVQIPDSDEIMADILAPSYSYDSKGRILIQAKDEIKKATGRSPDIGDALSLTFAEPVRLKVERKIEAIQFGVLDDYTGY